MLYVVDTHALVWYLEGSDKLGKKALSVLDDEKSKLVIPTIVLAEIKYLSDKQRTKLFFEDIINIVEQDDRCILFPLDVNVIKFIPTKLDIHDGIICGTAFVYSKLLREETTVVTKDSEIIDSKLIKTIWD